MPLNFEHQTLAALLVQHRPTFRPDFPEWLTSNLHIWDAFSREVFKVHARGVTRYSARTVGEVLRHHSALYEVGGPWKLDNDRIPDMARLFMVRHPSFAGFFELRGRAVAN
jgi:hypothetical protein